MHKAHLDPPCVSRCHSTSWTFRPWPWMPSGSLFRRHSDGYGGILPLALSRNGYQDPGVPSAYGGAASDALGLLIIMLVAESLSNLGHGRTWKISEAILENSDKQKTSDPASQ